MTTVSGGSNESVYFSSQNGGGESVCRLTL